MARAGGDAETLRLIKSGPTFEGEGGARDERLARKALNDQGNSERFRARYGADFKFAAEIGPHAWAKTHWSARDGGSLLMQAAQKTAVKIYAAADAAAAKPEEFGLKRPGELRAWANESGNRGRLAAMTALSEPYLGCHVDELDADPHLFNVENGTLELPADQAKDLRLRRHARRDLITKIAPVGYDPNAVALRWLAFLDWALPEKDKRLFMQRLAGYCLVGDASEQAFVFLHGRGANGKSVLTSTLQWVLAGYAEVIPFAALTADARRRGSEASPELADLAGARAVFSAESNPGSRLDVGRINALTGGEVVKVRHLHKEFFKLRPRFKLICAFNNKPAIRDPSEGIWRRLMLVHFTRSLPRDQWDLQLVNKLCEEGPGILNWMLDGWRMWRERGLDPPEAVRAATRKYRDESDPIGTFLDAATARREGANVAARELYACFVGWCDAGGISPMTQTLFGRLLVEREIEKYRSNTTFYRGIEILADLDFDWKAP